MISMKLTEIAESLNGKFNGSDRVIKGVSIDTRNIKKDELFFAIKGSNFDGNDYANEALNKGACAAIIDNPYISNNQKILVPNVKSALGELARLWKSKLPSQIIAVTGSNGKTTLKEILGTCLSVTHKTFSTKGNFNNDVGLPLMIFEMNNSYEFAVLEMGANKEHEIEHLVEIASPDIVVINNAALAHLDGFINIDGVAKAKGEILQGSKSPNFAILNRDDNYFDLWSNMGKQSEIISFGSDSKAMVYPRNIILEKNYCTFDLNCPHGLETINLNLPGIHNVINACAAAAVMYSLSKDISEIKKGLESVTPVTGRLEFISLKSGHEIINDTYNANPKSTLAAIDYLKSNRNTKVFVFGDMLELGVNKRQMHNIIGDKLNEAGVDYLFGFGEMTKYTVNKFNNHGLWYEDINLLINDLKKLMLEDNGITILVKGSRSMRMERVIQEIIK
tara:strand:- start:2 stop:1348 length:1347 start_codon:yes stop_codon:yes gene_type:complete